MWYRSAVAAGVALALAPAAPAQLSNVYTRAVPPEKTALDRLNLRTEWAVNLPVANVRESLSLVQTLDDQVFVQTRTGLFIALDARTGQIQWSANIGTGSGYANVYPVAANTRFVFAANITKLFAFHRYSGVVEFIHDIGSTTTTGLAADEDHVYVVGSIRIGGTGSHRVVCYGLPPPIPLPQAGKVAKPGDLASGAGGAAARDPATELMSRYPAPGVSRTPPGRSEFDTVDTPPVRDGSFVGSTPATRTASLSTLPSVLPPYTLQGQHRTPSISTLPSLRRPYHLQDESGRYVQRTPSITTIPPSVAASMLLGDLRPRAVSPPLVWEYGTTRRMMYTPLVAPVRVWGVGEGRRISALSKVDAAREVVTELPADGSGQPTQGDTTGYFPLADGTLIAIDLNAGDLVSGYMARWRANVGGLMNRAPLVTRGAVFVAGENSGVSRVDRGTGAVQWRSDPATDRVVAVNEEFAYLMDRQGRLRVYDARRPTDPSSGRSTALTGLDVSAFNIPITNTVSDRLYLASANGLLVCLRDASPKYVRPVSMAPVVTRDVSRRDPNAPEAPPMPKEEEKKDDEKKKDEEKKDDKKEEEKK